MEFQNQSKQRLDTTMMKKLRITQKDTKDI